MLYTSEVHFHDAKVLTFAEICNTLTRILLYQTPNSPSALSGVRVCELYECRFAKVVSPYLLVGVFVFNANFANEAIFFDFLRAHASNP